MFDSLKAMGALAALMKDKEKLQRSSERVQEVLGASRVTGEAGGGAVRVTMSGRMMVVSVEIDRVLASAMGGSEENRRAGEELIAEASNAAIVKAQALMQQIVSKEARDLGLPELPGLQNLLGGA